MTSVYDQDPHMFIKLMFILALILILVEYFPNGKNQGSILKLLTESF